MREGRVQGGADGGSGLLQLEVVDGVALVARDLL